MCCNQSVACHRLMHLVLSSVRRNALYCFAILWCFAFCPMPGQSNIVLSRTAVCAAVCTDDHVCACRKCLIRRRRSVRRSKSLAKKLLMKAGLVFCVFVHVDSFLCVQETRRLQEAESRRAGWRCMHFSMWTVYGITSHSPDCRCEWCKYRRERFVHVDMWSQLIAVPI